jgi:hypothetical protein
MKGIKTVLAAILVIGIVVGATSCGGKAEDNELKTYSNHDFSFKYPKTFRVTNETVVNGNFLVAVSRIELVTSEFQSFMVVCGQGRPYGETLDWNQCQYYLDSAKQGDTQENGEYLWSSTFETTKSGHRVIYKCYTETHTWSDVVGTTTYTGTVTDYGVTAIFFCDKSNRTFVLSTFCSDNVIHSWIEASEDFMIYLDSFICH